MLSVVEVSSSNSQFLVDTFENWIFPKKKKNNLFAVLVGIFEKKVVVSPETFSPLVLPLLFFYSFIDSCLFCDCSDMDIGRGSSVVSSRLISCLVISSHFFSTVFSTFFVYDNCCFFLFCFSVSFSFPFSHSCFPSVFVTCLSSLAFQKPFLFYFFLLDLSYKNFFYESFPFSTSPFSFF